MAPCAITGQILAQQKVHGSYQTKHTQKNLPSPFHKNVTKPLPHCFKASFLKAGLTDTGLKGGGLILKMTAGHVAGKHNPFCRGCINVPLWAITALVAGYYLKNKNFQMYWLPLHQPGGFFLRIFRFPSCIKQFPINHILAYSAY